MRMSTGLTWFQSMAVMSPRFGASGQWRAKSSATGRDDLGEPDGLGIERVQDGEVEAAVSAEQRPNPKLGRVRSVVHEGPGESDTDRSYSLAAAGLVTCQVHARPLLPDRR